GILSRVTPEGSMQSLLGGRDRPGERRRIPFAALAATVFLAACQPETEGIVIATGAEPGEVVQAGQWIIRVARKDGRDAVFDVPAQILRSAPSDPIITVSLTDDPKVTATGRVREVSPQADPVTRTFEVKVGLNAPPAAMRLGATVVGRMQ